MFKFLIEVYCAGCILWCSALIGFKTTVFFFYLVNSRRYERARLGKIEEEFKK